MSVLKAIGTYALCYLVQAALFVFGLFGLIAICFFAFPIVNNLLFDRLDLYLRGQIAPSVIRDHELRIDFWHQNPGTLQNGVLVVKATGDTLKLPPGAAFAEQVWSFDSWAPNESAMHTCTFYLASIPKKPDFTVQVSVKAKGLQTFDTTFAWDGQKWRVAAPAKASGDAPVVAKNNS